MTRTGIVRHPLYIEHDMGAFHPETPRRLTSIYAMLDTPEMVGRFTEIEPRKSGFSDLVRVHDPGYIQTVAATKGRTVSLDPDTSTCPASYDAAILAAGGTLAAIDAVMYGRVRNAFCLHRPPGHHAERDRAMGFCFFNNVAVGATHAIETHELERVLIVDPDLHHGNGTQHSFYHQNNVLYMSTHQYPFYPGTGHYREVGDGEGRGFTVNVPLDYGFGDGDFERVFDELLMPIARAYRPELVLMSAGYDTYIDDPLGAMRVTPHGFGIMFDRLLALADECCDGRFVAVLEGGYHLQGLTDSVRTSLCVMDAEPGARGEWTAEPLRRDAVDSVIRTVRQTHAPYWPGL